MINSDLYIKQNSVKELFISELQNIITQLICLYLASIFNSKKVPLGFCKKVENTLYKSALGDMRELLLWLASKSKEKTLDKLTRYLLEEEKERKKWFGTFITLRNRYYHPKEETQEEIIERAIQLLPGMFRFNDYGNFILEEKVYWESDGEKICLHPFVLNQSGEMIFPKGINSEGNFIFSGNFDVSTNEINKVWEEMRVLDEELVNPTTQELINKSKNKFIPPESEVPWWYGKIQEKSSGVYLIEEELSKNLISKIQIEDKDFIPILLDLKENNVMEEVTRKLGIMQIKKVKDFVETFKQNKLALAIKTDKLNTKEFIQLIIWSRDILPEFKQGSVKIFIERANNKIRLEQEKIYHKIENIGSILEKPQGSKGNDLLSYVWTRNMRKKVLGLF